MNADFPDIDIHSDIKAKLDYFNQTDSIPNILFHGPHGAGKKTIVFEFVKNIYKNDSDKIKDYILNINCTHGKGIKFIRDELKFFAKTQISSSSCVFKSIILLNADKLTPDAQSALRRCIEVFSYNTRFFIVLENKHKILKPILSRFCDIYIPEPIYEGRRINLYRYHINLAFGDNNIQKNKIVRLKKYITREVIDGVCQTGECPEQIYERLVAISSDIYDKGYSGMDLIAMISRTTIVDDLMSVVKKHELLMAFGKIRKDIRDERLIILFILNFSFISSYYCLENISFM